MHINVSGGNAVIGNISQGHGNQIHAEQEISLTAEQLEYFYQALDELIADKKLLGRTISRLKTR